MAKYHLEDSEGKLACIFECEGQEDDPKAQFTPLMKRYGVFFFRDVME
jgi:hypothetical protein